MLKSTVENVCVSAYLTFRRKGYTPTFIGSSVLIVIESLALPVAEIVNMLSSGKISVAGSTTWYSMAPQCYGAVAMFKVISLSASQIRLTPS